MKNENERHDIQIEEIGCIYASFNFTKPGPHHDIHFRKAWREIYDVETILHNLEGANRTIAASSFFPERSRQVPNRPYSLEKAKEYLKKSTYNGETIHIYFFAFKDSANDAYFLKERL